MIKNLKKANIIKSLSGTVSAWDLLSSTLENENLQEFSKELNTLFTNLKSISKSLKLVSKCKSNPIDNSQMVKLKLVPVFIRHFIIVFEFI